jgi:hypothetical protein
MGKVAIHQETRLTYLIDDRKYCIVDFVELWESKSCFALELNVH